MKEQAAIQKKISEKLNETKVKNPSFSIRAFSKRLGVSPTTLSLILSGRRNVSRKLAESLVDRLDLSPWESHEILSLFPKKRPYRRGADDVDSTQSLQLTMDQYHVVSEWHHFAIRALLRTQDAQKSPRHSRPEWIAERLGIKAREASSAIERMLRLEMIERLPDGSLRATRASYRSPDGIPSASIRRNHSQHLELARASLARDSVEIRDFTNLTIAINPKKLSEAKKIIRRFRNEVEAVLEDDSSGPRSEVYSVAVQLFPLTRVHE